METGIELKQITPYFNHDVEVKGLEGKVWKIDLISGRKIGLKFGPETGYHFRIISHEEFQQDYNLLLHPLSMLTKEIQHKGEAFVMSEYLLEKYAPHIDEPFINQILEDHRWINHLPHFIYEDLVSKMFDVNDLIPRNLALDKSTLKQ